MQAVLNTQELETQLVFFGRWILLNGFFKDRVIGFFSDNGLLDGLTWTLDIFHRLGLAIVWTLDGSIGHWIWTIGF